MNAGIIASRYAKAFLKYVQENGNGKKIYSQSCILMASMAELPELKDFLTDSTDISLQMKVELMKSSLNEEVNPAIVRFLKMAAEHRRLEFFPRMLLSFIEQYREAKGIKVGELVTSVPLNGLRERLEEIFNEKTGAEVHLYEKVDADIIGGFIFEMEGYRLDASVKNRLQMIHRRLVEKNNRIV